MKLCLVNLLYLIVVVVVVIVQMNVNVRGHACSTELIENVPSGPSGYRDADCVVAFFDSTATTTTTINYYRC